MRIPRLEMAKSLGRGGQEKGRGGQDRSKGRQGKGRGGQDKGGRSSKGEQEALFERWLAQPLAPHPGIQEQLLEAEAGSATWQEQEGQAGATWQEQEGQAGGRLAPEGQAVLGRRTVMESRTSVEEGRKRRGAGGEAGERRGGEEDPLEGKCASPAPDGPRDPQPPLGPTHEPLP